VSSPKLVPADLRLTTAREFIDAISDRGVRPKHGVYAFLGRHVPVANNGIQRADDRVRDTVVDVYRDMILGKQVLQDDTRLMVRRIDYTSNRLFNMYDDQDRDLAITDYYTMVDAGAYHHVWKCLDNNQEANSTASPSFEDVTVGGDPVRTSDGYLWKYLWSVTDVDVERFATEDYFPYVANTDVTDVAVDGKLEVIRIEDGGQGYGNYLTGTFGGADIRVNGNTLLYSVGSTLNACTVSGFYTGCVIYLSAGTGAGQYRKLVDHFSNGNGNFIVVETEFSTPPTNSTEFQIHPAVLIFGNGSETVNADARALINAVGNTVYRVEVLSAGLDYQVASANVVANSVVGVDRVAEIRPIIAPFGGHGYDPASELGATAVSIEISVANTESNTVPCDSQFQQVGVLIDPLFSNAVLNFSNGVAGTWNLGETVMVVDPRLLRQNVTAVVDSLQISADSLGDRVRVGDWVYLVGTSGTQYHLANVTAIVNATHINISSNVAWSCTETYLYLANVVTEAIVTELMTANTVRVGRIAGTFENGDIVVGLDTGTRGEVDTVERSGVEKGFDTYVQMWRYDGTVTGTFTDNEKVFVGSTLANSTANGSLHSSTSDGGGGFVVYVSNTYGNLAVGFQGANSAASLTVAEAHPPELVHGSGRVIYLENITAVPRDADDTDHLNLIIQF
jgi:hypothetical protein